jgi:membrane protein implicated in regulation of membrane protease activity
LGAVDFYLVCFIVGFVLSLVSFMAGSMHMDVSHHGGDLMPGAHVGGDVGAHVGGDANGPASHVGHAPTMSPFNFSTLMVFLAWFGGAGALLVSQWHAGLLVALAGSTASGLFGASLVFTFITKVLLVHDASMSPRDYQLKGTIGTLTLGIREGGTGEISYVQGGTRKLCAARGLDGCVIPNGTEVVVVRFDQGIAYVRRWDVLPGTTEPKKLQEGKTL